ncbi:HBL/NHE enterotoxin family protein [Shewanella sp. YLB-07]|uniref:HBL/NHE enterotoxin family protein n=1 Tax=Shewanella sp. YLB-07 TaxID=2601268 RepID=UPI00128C4CA9|nr:HBL/NHE enterotoxin family protein [Shewanella sp. YLB-07]MPY24514.1 HBL/NHE enterotoxin family protein [Shewanella sp. YLB-07]
MTSTNTTNENPDKALGKHIKAGADAAAIVTRYAQATLTAVPALPDSPSWVAPIEAHLQTAKGHATTWLQSICPDMCTNIPKSIIEYSSHFQTNSGEILNLLQQIQGSGGKANQQQRNSIKALFNQLGAHIQSQHKLLTALQNKIKSYSNNIKSDQDVLAADLGNVSEKFAGANEWIQNIKTDMGENFLQSTVLGPCIAIVEINTNISIKVQGSGANPAIITLVFAKAILENQTNNAAPAEQAVQAVLDSWATLNVKNEAVIADLQSASDDDYCNILEQVDLLTAQNQWQQLADYAQSLLN